MSEINKKSLEHLASLARIKLSPEEGDNFLKDLEKILNHFKELQKVNTDDVMPMTGGTNLKNIFREDKVVTDDESDIVRDSLLNKKEGFLKVPPIFE